MLNKFTLLICLFSVLVAINFETSEQRIEYKVENLEGHIVSEQSFSKKNSNFILETTDGDRILIRTDKYLNYSYGDKILVSGDLKIPKNFESENGIEFDYKNFLLKDDIIYTTFFPEIEVIENNSKKGLFVAIFGLKEKLVLQSKKVFSPRTSSLVLGILLGLKDSINESLEENFRRTGLIHVLVLSGFNLTIIAYFVFKLLGKFHRSTRYILSLFLIFTFVIMVGAGATVVRASIMISIFILSKLFRRNSNPNNALLLAASSMILHNPMILFHDPSFQLSFVATVGLVNFYPVLEKIFFFTSQKFALREIIVSNIAVQLAVTPLLSYMMGEFSVIALIPNVLVLPIIPIFMLVSFLAIVVSFLGIGFYLPFVLLTEIFANLMNLVVNLFGSLGFATLKINLDLKYLTMIYTILISLIIFLQIREQIILKRRYSYFQ